MKNYTKQYLKALTREYPHMNEYIESRREELLHPVEREIDQNIGGGQGNQVGNPVESVVMRITQDDKLNAYEKNKLAIEVSLKKLDPILQKVIHCRYFKQLSQDDTSQELAMTVAMIRSAEYEFFRNLARRLELMM